MTGAQMGIGIAVAAILTGLTIQAVRAAKKSGEYVVQASPMPGGWIWQISKKGSDGIVADSRTDTPPGTFPNRPLANAAGRKYASDKLGAKAG